MQEAITLAANLLGQTLSTNTDYCWLPPIVCNGPSIVNLEDKMTEDPEDAAAIAPEALLLDDILDGRDYNDEKEKHIPIVHLQWEVLHVSTLNLVFFMPALFSSHKQNLTIDQSAVPSNSLMSDVVPLLAHERASSEGFGSFMFAPKDMELLHSTEAWLNDTCVNGCAALLHSALIGDEVTPFSVLSTHNLPQI